MQKTFANNCLKTLDNYRKENNIVMKKTTKKKTHKNEDYPSCP